MKSLLVKILSLLMLWLGMAVFVPEAVAFPAASAASTLTQRERQKQQKQKKREREKALKAKRKAVKKERSDKKRARKTEQRQKAADRKADRQDAIAYQQEVERINRHNRKAAQAASRDISHAIGVWGQAGYSSLFQNFNSTDFSARSIGGFGGGAGLGYQLRYRHFLLNTGLEFEMFNSSTRFLNAADGVFSRTFTMSPYPSMKYTYNFSNLSDYTKAGFLQLPLLMGGEWGRWYFLAGPKLGWGLVGTSSTSTLLSTQITDEELIVPLEDMASHTLVTDRPYQGSSARVDFGLHLGLAAEAGIWLDEWLRPKPAKNASRSAGGFAERMRYRLGVFAEYGVLNVQRASNAVTGRDLPVLFNDPAQPLDLTPVPMLTMESARDVRVNPFLVGVKLAVFYELPRKQPKILPLPPEPLPRLAAQVVNAETRKPLSGAAVAITSVERGRTVSKTTGKTGLVVLKQRRGDYRLSAQRAGFLPGDTLDYTLSADLKDTVVLALRAVPKPLKPTLAGYVRDAVTRHPLEAQITLFALADDRELYAGQASDDGLFATTLEAGTYRSRLTMPGYMPADDTVRFTGDTVFLFMQRIREGRKVVLRNMFFATGKTRILPQSEPTLEELAAFMQDNPEVKIRIIGHTDAVGSEESNQRLSEGRAAAVRADLMARGVDAARIEAEGRGETEPVADNDTEEGRSRNRRVEFVITATGNTDIEQIKDYL
ncbi:MAG: OmpA family protein [Paludibacteraceae bacterium]|nr:OmpA family protein [Paludibacteraceae bacterium]